MNRTPIEWVKNPDGTQGYTWNPITGCLNHTPEGLCLGGMFPCYAFKLANGRLKQRYLANKNIAIPADLDETQRKMLELPALLDPFYPRFWRYRLAEPIEHPRHYDLPKQKGIFVCDMSDLFGIGIPEEWTEQVMFRIKLCPYHRFYLLTKQPQNLIKFSPFSPNCWVGVTATNREQYLTATSWKGLDGIKASVKYISFEPLLESIQPSEYRLKAVNWVIIGACTGSQKELLALAESIAFKQGKTVSDFSLIPYGKQWTLQPKIEWVEEIVRACDEAGVPVFLKDNLMPLLRESVVSWKRDPHYLLGGILRQEMPKEGLERLKGIK